MAEYLNRVVKGYELREKIGAGGFGAVYRAYQPAIGREVAVKVILPEHANQPEFIHRFEVEAQFVARLEHPHIVPLYDYWRDPDGAFLVMRWLRGNLRVSIQQGAWSPEASARLLNQLAAALAVAHREGIIHRDIKPDNILLDEDDNAYLADFGIAKNLDMPSTTEEGVLVGSPAYITPEQIKGDPVSSKSDIYSLGLVIYELLLGEKPYADATTPVELISRHLNIPLPRLHPRKPTVSAALDEVLQTATAKNPDQRYANVLRFAAAFQAGVSGSLASGALLEPLTPRELDILRLMVDSLSNGQIAEKLFLSAGTVKWYVNQIYTKLDVHSRVQAIERARQLNLLTKPRVPATQEESLLADETERTAVTNSPAPVALPELANPYKGLRAFQEADTADFFGRAALTEQLLGRLTTNDDGARFLAVVGPSGSGKSSVVRAGLVPALRKGAMPNSSRWFITDMLPGTHPFEELEAALLRVASSHLPDLLHQLTEDRRGLVRAGKRLLPNDMNVELVLIIDQFEELFTMVEDEALRHQFIDSLLAAITDPRSRIRVVLTLRADFYDRPLMYPRLAELMRSHSEVIVPMTASELERAITGPAERVGLTVEAGLTGVIINDILGQPGSLPLLQFALSELYNHREDRLLSIAAYRNNGSISGALTHRADELYSTLDAPGQSAVRQLFLRMIVPGEGTEDTRRRVLQTELMSLVGDERTAEDLIDLFSKYRLFTRDHDPLTRGPTIEIAHEALIRSWKRLRSWIAAAREELRIQRRLSVATEEWIGSGRDVSYLASGARLIQFEALAASGTLALNESETTYLKASVAERERLHMVEQERQRHELALARKSANAEHRAATRLRYLVGLMVMAVILAVGLSTFALNRQQLADLNAQQALNNAAESQNVALIAGSQAALANNNTDQAIALALQAVTLDPKSARAQTALSAAAYAPGTIRRFVGHTAYVDGLASSPDGRLAISASWDKTVILWDIQTGALLHRFEGHSDKAAAVAFAPDGLSAISGSTDKTMIQWDIKTGGIIRRFVGQPDQIWAVAISPDGQYVVAGGPPDALILWDIKTGAMIRHFEGHRDAIQTVRFSADGLNLVSASNDKTVILWDVATGQLIHRFEGHTAEAYSAVFGPDGRTILSGSFDGTMALWDIKSGEILRRFNDGSPVYDVAFSPDGHTILSGGVTGLTLWNVETAQPISRLRGHTGAVNAIVFSPDGRTALSASADSTVRLWDLEAGQIIRRFSNDNLGIWTGALAASPDGHTAIAAFNSNPSNTIVEWDIHTGREVSRYSTNQNVADIAISPDGQKALFAVDQGNMPGDMILWDVNTGQEIRRFTGHPAGIQGVGFSPDGRTAASAGRNGVLLLWDIATGTIIRRFSGYETYSPDNTNVWQFVRFSPNGKTIITTHLNGLIVLWDVATGKEIRHFEGLSGGTLNVVFSGDGQRAFAGAGDNTAILWDVATGAIRHRLIDHSSGVLHVDMTLDARFGIAGSADYTTMLWDLQSGTLIRKYQSGPFSVIFASDAHTALVGILPNQIELWRMDLTPDELLTWIHGNRYIPELTCDQRTLYKLTTSCDDNAAALTAAP